MLAYSQTKLIFYLEHFSFDTDNSVDHVQACQGLDIVADRWSGVIPITNQKSDLNFPFDCGYNECDVIFNVEVIDLVKLIKA